MKRILIMSIILVTILNVKAQELVDNAKSAILIEPETKTILYEKNIHDEVSIASLTKMMGLILIFEKIENGEIHYDDKVIVSKNAQDMGGSQIWLEAGEEMSVEDLLKGIIMASANDGIMAMAEFVGGDEKAFVEMMNNKAKDLNLKNTHFVNSTGLDENGHYSSSYDVSLIAIELMKHKDVFKFTTIYEDYLRQDTDKKFWLVNTNKLIKSYKGADGLKTGMTDNAGYCMAVTAKRGDMRLLAIVLGEKEGKVRNQETSELLDYGFNNYEMMVLRRKGEKVSSVTFEKANPSEIKVMIKEDITILKKKNDNKKDYNSEIKLNSIELPIKKGDIVGKIMIKDENKIIREVDLVSNSDMFKKSFLNLWWELLKNSFTGNLL